MIINLSLEGSQFGNSLDGIKRQIKLAESTMKANMAVLGSAGKSYEALSQKATDLGNVMEAERKQTDELTRRREVLIASGKAGTAQEAKLIEQINKSVARYANYERQLGSTNKELAYSAEGVNTLSNELKQSIASTDASAKALKRAGDEAGALSVRQEGLQSQLETSNNLVQAQERVVGRLTTQFGENSQEVRDAQRHLQQLGSQYQNLQTELQATSTQLDELGNSDVGGQLDSITDKAKGFGDTLTGAFTAPLVALAGLSTMIGKEFETISAKVQALTNEAIESAKSVTEEINESAGKGYDKATQAQLQQYSQARGIDASESQESAEIAEALSTVTEFDGKNVITLMAQMKSKYGYSIQQTEMFAQKLAMVGVEDLDEINEYLPQLADQGVTPEQFLNSIQSAMASGAWSSDKAGDLLAEGAKRAVAPSKAIDDAGMGKVQGKLIAGDIDYAEYLTEAKKKASKLPLQKRKEFWATVLGTQGEDIDLTTIDNMIQSIQKKHTDLKVAISASDAVEQSPYAKMTGEISKMKDALIPLGTALATMGAQIAVAVTPFVQQLSEWFTGLSASSQKTVIGIGALVAGLPLLISVVTRVISPVRSLIGLFKGAPNATGQAGAGVGRFRKVLDGLKTVFTKLGSVFKNVFKVAIEGVKIAFKALSTAFRANPIGAVITVVMLLVSALVYAYKNSEKFRGFVDKLWAKLKELGSWLGKWVKKLWAGIKDVFGKVIDIMKKVVTIYVTAWKKIFTTIFNAVKKIVSSVKDFVKNVLRVFTDMKNGAVDIFNSVVNWVKKFPEKLWKAILDKKDTMVSKMKSFGKAIGEGIESGINGAIRGINKLLHMIGVGSGDYDPLKKVKIKYANGTPNGGHGGGLAMVNDGAGSKYKELVRLPNGQQFIPEGRNQVLNLPKGTQVLSGSKTHSVMSSHGMPRYNWGTKAWDGIKSAGSATKDFVVDTSIKAWDGTKSIVKGVADKVKDYSELIKHPIKYTKIMVQTMLEKLGNNDLLNNFAGGFSGFVSKHAKDFILKQANLKKSQEEGTADFGGFTKWGGSFSAMTNGYGVYDYLYSIAQQLMKSKAGKGLVITSGQRNGDAHDHGRHLGLDLSGWGSNGGYKNIAKAVSKHPYLSYAIGDNTVFGKKYRDGSMPAWAKGHMNHLHMSALSPKDAKKQNKTASSGFGSVAEWRDDIVRASKQMKVKLSASDITGILAQIQRESGGNQTVTQSAGVNDINMRRGNPAQGLLQYIPSTFKNYAVKGHTNIRSGFDQLLAFFNNSSWKKDLPNGLSGWSPRGARRYANGGLITSPTLAMAGEAGSEMVIPLTRKSRAMQLINQASALIGVDSPYNNNSKGSGSSDNALLEKMAVQIEQQGQMINLLAQLVAKDQGVYLDGKEITATVDNHKQAQQRRINQARGI